MSDFPARSPAEKVGGIVYFGRMLDKIRADARGELPPEYQQNLGRGFDATCVSFLHVDYESLAARTRTGASDEDVLHWCFADGRQPTDEEIHIWNTFMRKRGWNDEISDTLIRRKNEAGMGERSDVQTMFDFIDADEGRPVRDHREI